MTKIANTAVRIAALAVAGLVINSGAMHSSEAQIAALPQPEYSVRDENNVDLLSFNLYLEQTDLSIGAKEHPLTHTIYSGFDGGWGNPVLAPGVFFEDQFTYSYLAYTCKGSFTSPCPTQVTRVNCPGVLGKVYVEVHFQNATETFATCSLHTIRPTGSTLAYNSDGTYSYTNRDGTIVVFNPPPLTGSAMATQVLYPDGRVLRLWRCADGPGAQWLCSVTRSDGLQLKYNYSKNSSGVWQETSVMAINNAYEYCNPTASACALKMTWPTANYALTALVGPLVFTVTDAAGRVTRYTEDSHSRTVGIKLPSSASADNFTYTYCDYNWPQCTGSSSDYEGFVLRVLRDGQTWNYSGTLGGPCAISTYGFTNPVGSGKRVSVYNEMFCSTTSPGFVPLVQLTDEDGVQFNINQPTDPGIYGLPKDAIKPEENLTNYAWDARGNLTQETLVPKPNTPLAPVTLSANYDATCTIRVKCNKPNWVKDGRLNETDYTYDPTHGGVLTETLPADANGIRPQKRYTYTQRYAWVLDAAGAYVKSAAPIWVLETESYCRTSAATSNGCTLTGDQVVTTYDYGPDSGPNNLFLKGMAVTADGVTHRTCYSYDAFGNKISETLPRAGLASCP